MSVSSHELRAGMESAMEAIAEDFLQQRTLFNPDAEVNSLTERIWSLERYGVPRKVIGELLSDVGAVLESIDRALVHERRAAGVLDESARVAHSAECNDGQAVERALTVKSLARAVRPHLKVIAAHGSDSPEGIMARREVERLIAGQPQTKLTGGTLRKELRPTAHDVLLAVLATGVAA